MTNKKKNTSKFKIFLPRKRTLVSSLCGLLIVFYIFLTLQTVASGSKLSFLENKANELTKENKELTLQLVEASSLSKLSENATDLGFAKPDNVVYINQQETAAMLP